MEPVEQHQNSQPARERGRVEHREQVKPCKDAGETSGHQFRDLAPGDVMAIAAEQRHAGDESDQRPRRDQRLHRDDKAEQRHRCGGAKTGRATQRIAGDHDHAAIGDLERRQELDGGLRAATNGLGSAPDRLAARCRWRDKMVSQWYSASRCAPMQHDDNVSRGVISAAGAAVAARAQAPRARGPLVWLDMDQQALDDAYDQIVYAPNREQVTQRRLANSARARAAIGEPERVAYGKTEIEKLDIYRTKQT